MIEFYCTLFAVRTVLLFNDLYSLYLKPVYVCWIAYTLCLDAAYMAHVIVLRRLLYMRYYVIVYYWTISTVTYFLSVIFCIL